MTKKKQTNIFRAGPSHPRINACMVHLRFRISCYMYSLLVHLCVTFSPDFTVVCYNEYSGQLVSLYFLTNLICSKKCEKNIIEKMTKFICGKRFTYVLINWNCLVQFCEIPWKQTTDVHRGSTLITRVITCR